MVTKLLKDHQSGWKSTTEPDSLPDGENMNANQMSSTRKLIQK